MDLNEITGIIIEEAIAIHKELGPGLLESVYEEALFYTLTQRGLLVQKQHPIPVFFRGIKMEIGFRADLLVADEVIVELKSIEVVPPVQYKKLLTYLRLASKKIGLLINFNETLLKNGIKRVIN